MSDNNGGSAPPGALIKPEYEGDENGGDDPKLSQQQSQQAASALQAQSQPAQNVGSSCASPNSTNYSNGSGGSGGGRNDVCRDFLNNVCFRGNRCRFYHPPEVANNPERSKEVIKEFCHDYQNKGCFRDSCRYVHCTREDMEEYMRTGKITESLARAVVAVTGQEVVDGRPLCKEYLSGRCSRGARCRFWHINAAEERERRQMERVAGGSSRGGGGAGGGSAYRGGSGYGMGQYDTGGYDYRRQPDYKRPRLEDSASYGGMGQTPNPPSPEAYMALQEENIALRRKIDVLKQTVAELSAANDNMIAETNRLRAKLQVQVPSVGGPPSMTDPSIVGSMATASALTGVLTSATQGLAGGPPQTGTMPGGIAPDHLAAVSLAAVAQQSMAAAQQSMAMSATSDAVHWSAQMRR